MKNIKLFFIIISSSFLFLSDSYGQYLDKKIVLLKSVQGNAHIYTITDLYNETNLNYDTSIVYQGIPKEITSYIIKTLDFQPEQSIYELYFRSGGKMSIEVLKEGLKMHNLSISDTINLSKHPVKHFISFLSGRNSKGETIIIGDANNNYNFADDKLFLFDSSFFQNTGVSDDGFGTNLFHYQYVYKGQVVNKTVRLRVLPAYHNFKYSDSIEQKFYMVVFLEEYKKGFIKTKDSSISINVILSKFPAVSFNAGNSKIYFNGDETNYTVIGDTMHIEKKKYTIDNISYFGDSLFLSYTGEGGNKIFGIDSGLYAYNISGIDLISKKYFESNKYTNKYLFLDFWGSWCEPCIASIPDLVSISKRYKNKVQIVSIAEDYPSRIDTLKKIIKNNQMNWIHLFENLKEISKNSIADKYKIQFYPTQILINSQGKIIYRSKKGELPMTEQKMSSLINNDRP